MGGYVKNKAICRRISDGSKRKVSRLILKRKAAVIPTLLLAFGISASLFGIKNFIELAEEQKSPVTVFSSNTGNVDASNLSAQVKEVQYVTAYQDGMITLTLGEFFGEVTIYGLETEYLNLRYSDAMAVPIDNAMPYILLDEGVFSKLKNDSGKMIEIDSVRDYIMTTVGLGEKQNAARICGIIENDNINNRAEKKDESLGKTPSFENRQSDNVSFDDEGSCCIYTTTKGFDKLMSPSLEETALEDIQLSRKELEENISVLPEDGTVIRTKATINVDEENQSCLILLKSGKRLEKIFNQFQQMGMDIQVSEKLQGKIQHWSILALTIKSQMMIGIILILAGYVIFYYQQCLWEVEHLEFLFWLQDLFHLKKEGKGIFINVWLMLTVRSSLLGSGFFLAMLLFWG